MKFYYVILILLFVVSINHAYAHGIGGETLPPVLIDDRNATIQISVEPAVFDENQKENKILLKFFDINTGNSINNVTYRLDLQHNGNQVISDTFFDENGNLVIDTINDLEDITISGKKEPILGGWMTNGTNPVTIRGPIFSSGGIYYFKIKILSYDTLRFVKDPIAFDGAISIAENTIHQVQGVDGKSYNLGITSYYDQISEFEYIDKKISFSMLFNWSKENIDKTNIVHEEIHIPKTFGDLLFPNYDVYANGTLLPKDAILVDDYSESDRVIHVILHQKELYSMQSRMQKESQMIPSGISFSLTPSKGIDFPLSVHTTSLEYKIDFSWSPDIIHTGTETVFNVAISEQFVSKKIPRPAEYDFVIKQYGKEIFRTHHTGTLNSDTPDQIHYEFSDYQKGTIEIFIEKIDNKYLADAEFVSVVNPTQPPNQKFPVRIPSTRLDGNNLVGGRYYVDITWIPSPITLYDESEFIITIYDKDTLRPVPQTKYNFVLEKNGTRIFEKSGYAPAGGSFENFRFLKEHEGNGILRIEDIGGTGEFAEIQLNITPEFSSYTVPILIISTFMIIIIAKKNRYSMHF